MRKLNLGCGFDKREGFVNADHFPECAPDVRLDIDQTPWPLEDNSFDHILMKHVLEHVSADFPSFSRFATRYFRGNGIDIGGSPDSLAGYRELFPLIQNVFVYDLPYGDGQILDNVTDATFDFLYSSHCLEHLRDPREALANWIRVVKPGGHLVVSVPDEDLYEQGVWPSRFNSDHKLSFTIAKSNSWSPLAECAIEFVLRKRVVAS